MAINLDARNDVFNFVESQVIKGNVLANDAVGMDVKLYLRAFDGTSVLAKKAGQVTDIVGTYGTFHVKSDGTFEYTLNDASKKGLFAGTTLTESLNYKISNGSGGTDMATLKLNIAGETVKPVVVDDNFNHTEGSKEVHDVLKNDIAGETGQLFLRSVSGNTIGAKQGLDQITDVKGQFGTFHFSPEGKFTYDLDPAVAKTLNAGQSVTETLQYYKVSDGASHTDVGTITLKVDGVTDVQSKTTVVLDFEDARSDSSSHVGTNYHGFNFDTGSPQNQGILVIDNDSFFTDGGSQINQPGGHNYAIDYDFTGHLNISKSNGTEFDFDSGYFNSFTGGSSLLRFVGMRDGAVAYDVQIQVGDRSQTNLHMDDVDSVQITGAPGFAMDNLQFSYDVMV